MNLSIQRHHETGEGVIAEIAKLTDTVALNFSCGKDSIAAWLAIRDHFKVVPVYHYQIPGLQFVEDALAYYEDFFGQRIVRMPNPAFHRMLNALVFQTPDRISKIMRLDFNEFDRDVTWMAAMQDAGYDPEEAWCCVGLRKSDNLTRWQAITKHGAINTNRRMFYPIFDWSKDRLFNELKAADVALPPDYLMFGRSFDGIQYQYLKPISERYPADYERILRWFPLADLELKRAEYAEKARNRIS